MSLIFWCDNTQPGWAVAGCAVRPPPLGAKRRQQALERIIRLYEGWHAAEPDQGYAEKAAERRLKLSAGNAEPTSAPVATEANAP